mgnify:CR=1 FL=1
MDFEFRNPVFDTAVNGESNRNPQKESALGTKTKIQQRADNDPFYEDLPSRNHLYQKLNRNLRNEDDELQSMRSNSPIVTHRSQTSEPIYTKEDESKLVQQSERTQKCYPKYEEPNALRDRHRQGLESPNSTSSSNEEIGDNSVLMVNMPKHTCRDTPYYYKLEEIQSTSIGSVSKPQDPSKVTTVKSSTRNSLPGGNNTASHDRTAYAEVPYYFVLENTANTKASVTGGNPERRRTFVFRPVKERSITKICSKKAVSVSNLLSCCEKVNLSRGFLVVTFLLMLLALTFSVVTFIMVMMMLRGRLGSNSCSCRGGGEWFEFPGTVRR